MQKVLKEEKRLSTEEKKFFFATQSSNVEEESDDSIDINITSPFLVHSKPTNAVTPLSKGQRVFKEFANIDKSQGFNSDKRRNSNDFSELREKTPPRDQSRQPSQKKYLERKQLANLAALAVQKTVTCEFALSDNFSDSDQELPDTPDLEKYSLILKDNPSAVCTLLLYLKQYSELLYAWGETFKAISVAKIASSSYRLLKAFHPEIKIAARP